MCTLLVLNDCVEGYPLIVAANRDERLDRPSVSPKMWAHEDNVYVHPIDKKCRGTWFGVSRDGWFTALTNQEDNLGNASATISRGSVVLDCLHSNNHEGVVEILSDLDLNAVRAFNLVYGRAGEMFLARAIAGKPVRITSLEKGINVVSNDCWGDQYAEKVKLVKKMTSSYLEEHAKQGNITVIMMYLMTVMGTGQSPVRSSPCPVRARLSTSIPKDQHAKATACSSLRGLNPNEI